MPEICHEIRNKLFVEESVDNYKDPIVYQNHLFEQYKLYLDSALKISSQRQSANSFFLTINTTIIAFISYIHFGTSISLGYYWIVAVAGIALSYMWYRLIRSYKDLNTAKFLVIHEIEKKLPLSPFDAEWEAVGRGNKPNLYLPFTNIEIKIPWVFIFLHVVTFIHSFPWNYLRE